MLDLERIFGYRDVTPGDRAGEPADGGTLPQAFEGQPALPSEGDRVTVTLDSNPEGEPAGGAVATRQLDRVIDCLNSYRGPRGIERLREVLDEAFAGAGLGELPWASEEEAAAYRPVALAGPERPTAGCRCGCSETVAVPIHNGQSTRLDCRECGRFVRVGVWYGAEE